MVRLKLYYNVQLLVISKSLLLLCTACIAYYRGVGTGPADPGTAWSKFPVAPSREPTIIINVKCEIKCSWWKKTCFVHIMTSSFKGAAHNWLKFHPNKLFNSVQALWIFSQARKQWQVYTVSQGVRRCNYGESIHSYQGLIFNKILAMAKDWVFSVR